MNVGEALQLGVKHLSRQGLPDPRLDAENVLSWVLNCDRSYLFAHPEAILSERQQNDFRHWLERRGQRYPLQYMRGRQEFYGRSFEVNSATLIPRPETETVVETALRLLKEMPAGQLWAADVGTGSGCIAAALACHEPRLRVSALDVSRPALETARRNFERLGCLARMELLESDVLSAVSRRREFYDLVVSNPPYVSPDQREKIDPSVAIYEPAEAVFAAAGGLEVYEKLFQQSPAVLKPSGLLVVELGYDLRNAVSKLASRYGWIEALVEKDLAGIDRCAAFRRCLGRSCDDGGQAGPQAGGGS